MAEQDLRSHNLALPEAIDTIYPELVSEEDVVDVWQYAILSCMPEMTDDYHSETSNALNVLVISQLTRLLI